MGVYVSLIGRYYAMCEHGLTAAVSRYGCYPQGVMQALHGAGAPAAARYRALKLPECLE